MSLGFVERRTSTVAVAIFATAIGLWGCGGKGDSIDRAPTPDGGSETDGSLDAEATFPDGGIGTGDLLVTRIVPDHGPFTGGTAAVLRGTGLSEEATITVGGRMVERADMELIDTRRLAIVVPPGDVGPADVVVSVGDVEVTLPGGYTYDRIYVEPNRGSVSGGTRVSVIGTGTAFAEGDSVIFGRSACEDVEVVSETRIRCSTPPLSAGTVDVTVVRGEDGSEIVAPDAFTYYDGSDPAGGGLGGGPLTGNLNVAAVNLATGGPVPDAFVMVGEDVSTEHQGLTDLRGQITFGGDDIVGDLTVHVAKHCFEKTSVVSFDASDVTVLLVPLQIPECGEAGGEPPMGHPRNGTFISGELIWRGPNEYGPNPWANIPEPREGEVKVAYVYTTQQAVSLPNPDPSVGGAVNRVLEVLPEGGDRAGYPYRIFARPAALAVYALAGLERPGTEERDPEFIPYIMGIARNVLGGPGEEVEDVDMVMNIPLDHTLDIRLENLPAPSRVGPDRFTVEAYIDLGGEGVIVRDVHEPLDVVRNRTAELPFRFWAQPALFGDLSDGRYRISAGWYTSAGDYDFYPFTVVTRNGVRDISTPVVVDSFLGIPQATSPAYGERLPADRVLRWDSDGPAPDLHMVLVTGGDGQPAWRYIAPGTVNEVPIPDLSSIPEISDIASGFVSWEVWAVSIPGFDYNEFSYEYMWPIYSRYEYLRERYWSHYATDRFTALR